MTAAAHALGVERALSKSERLPVVCVRQLARAIADGARGLAAADADHTDAVRRRRTN